jgi:hypothetical protein
MNFSRRTFITSAALAPVACGVPLGYERGIPVAQPSPLPIVRAPQVGQQWTYVKRDVFDGKSLGLITERIASVGSTIVIAIDCLMKFRAPGEWFPKIHTGA